MDLLEGAEIAGTLFRASPSYIGSVIKGSRATNPLQHLVGSLVALLGLSSAAIWNGYPIVYSDTASYLVSGFHLETLIDRPITYGLFLRLCSFNGWSLWTVVLAQCMLLAHVMGLMLRKVGLTNDLARGGVIAATALLTGLPFVSGQLLTDVFTPIVVITILLLLFDDAYSRSTRSRLYCIFLLAFAMHMSHVAVTGLILTTALILRTIWKTRPAGILRWRAFAVLLALSVVGTLAMGVAIAKSRNSFFAARMADSGILQAYLDEHCATDMFKLCAYKDRIRKDANAFLWADDTPMNIFKDRIEMDDELGRITKGTFSESKFIGMHLRAAATATIDQLTRFNVGDGNGPFGVGTKLHERVGMFIPSELHAFDSARQMNENQFQAPLILANGFYRLVFWASLLALVPLSLYRLRKAWMRGEINFIVPLLLPLCFIINAAVNSSLVMVADRFGTKMAWVNTLCVFLLLASTIDPLKASLKGSSTAV